MYFKTCPSSYVKVKRGGHFLDQLDPVLLFKLCSCTLTDIKEKVKQFLKNKIYLIDLIKL